MSETVILAQKRRDARKTAVTGIRIPPHLPSAPGKAPRRQIGVHMLDSWGASSGPPGALEPLPGDAEPKISTTTVIHARKRGRAGSDHSAATNDATDSPSVKSGRCRRRRPSRAAARRPSRTRRSPSCCRPATTGPPRGRARRASPRGSPRRAARREGRRRRGGVRTGSDRATARADVREGAVAAVVDVVLQATAGALMPAAVADELRAQADAARRLVAAHDRGAVQHAARGSSGSPRRRPRPPPPTARPRTRSGRTSC